jgi:hypothetical protein
VRHDGGIGLGDGGPRRQRRPAAAPDRGRAGADQRDDPRGVGRVPARVAPAPEVEPAFVLQHLGPPAGADQFGEPRPGDRDDPERAGAPAEGVHAGNEVGGVVGSGTGPPQGGHEHTGSDHEQPLVREESGGRRSPHPHRTGRPPGAAGPQLGQCSRDQPELRGGVPADGQPAGAGGPAANGAAAVHRAVVPGGRPGPAQLDGEGRAGGDPQLRAPGPGRAAQRPVRRREADQVGGHRGEVGPALHRRQGDHDPGRAGEVAVHGDPAQLDGVAHGHRQGPDRALLVQVRLVPAAVHGAAAVPRVRQPATGEADDVEAAAELRGGRHRVARTDRGRGGALAPGRVPELGPRSVADGQVLGEQLGPHDQVDGRTGITGHGEPADPVPLARGHLPEEHRAGDR